MQDHSVENAASATTQADGSTTETPTQSDPKAMVTAALQSAGHPDPTAWESRLPADLYRDAPHDGVRMFLINRTWRLIMGEAQAQGKDTFDARYGLVDGAKPEDWMRAFRQSVVSCALKHNLPLTKS